MLCYPPIPTTVADWEIFSVFLKMGMQGLLEDTKDG